ncbi:MAG: PRC-barrel domain-containing protein [Chloroflexota bacterium]
MRLGKSLIGKSVFCIADGRKLGQVKDLYVDDDLTSVVGIFLGREGLLRPTPRFIETADVALFGMEVVLTKETATVYGGEEAPEPPGWMRLTELEGRPVQTPGGTKVGRVGDVALDEEARITGVSLTSLSIKGPVAEAEAVARKAVVDVGAADGVMTIDLAEAEQAPLEIDPDILFSRPVPTEVSWPAEEPGPAEGGAETEGPTAAEGFEGEAESPQEPGCGEQG